MSDADKALEECRTALYLAIAVRKPSDEDLDTFREKFREDFEAQVTPEKWEKDRERVTTLARAIGGFAEFLAIAENAERVTFKQLEGAYRVLKPYCKDDTQGIRIRREYCSSYEP
jgi:hypothetical protein